MRPTDPPLVAPALRARGLSKRYGRTWALRDVDLDVQPGGVTALLGPNGAGKSTMMKSWISFERPTRGRVLVQDVDPWKDRAAALQRLAYVAQRPALYADLSAAEHLTLAEHLRHRFDKPAAIDRLAQLGIPLGQRAGRLSGGQQAQLALALALSARADILLLDEPLASLDPLARREFLQVLRDAISGNAGTALLSSHVVSDVTEGCDRLIVLGVGRVLYQGGIVEALAAHRVSEAGQYQVLDAKPIATFAGAGGERVELHRQDGSSGGRPANLEEIVVGYLTAGRASEPGAGEAA